MNSNSEEQGSGSGNGPIEPLEPGRPDVMPNPPPGAEDVPSKEGERPLDDDGETPLEEDMGDVDVANSVSNESPSPL